MKFLLLAFTLFLSTSVLSSEVHFFGSLDYARTTIDQNIEYDGIPNNFGTNITAGGNFSTQVDDKSQAIVQFIHNSDQNKIVTDLVQYQRNLPYEWKVRIGQQRLPVFLKSEVIQVKALYPWLTAPREVYDQLPIRSFAGASLEKELGPFSAQAYIGQANEQFGTKDFTVDVEVRDLLGLRLNFRKNNFEAYINALKISNANLNVETQVAISPPVYGTAKIDYAVKNMESYTTGFSWDDNKWLIMSEFVHLHSRDAAYQTITGGYSSLGYHFTEKYLLLGTFSNEFNKMATLRSDKRTAYELVLQYSIDMSTVLKVGANHVNTRVEGTTPTDNFNIYSLQLAFVF